MHRAALLACLALLSARADAHPGGLNSEGCHNNRKTGDYHCHGGGRSRPAPSASSLSTSFAPARAAPGAGGGSTYYRNCSHARAMGAAPVRRGDPGYSSRLDRDGDGVGCE